MWLIELKHDGLNEVYSYGFKIRNDTIEVTGAKMIADF